MLDTSSFAEGLLLGLGLFTSIGPKDTFVIKRALSGQHLIVLAMVCAGSDALLIVLGSAGLAALLARSPLFLSLSLWGGIAYLLCLGGLALRAAITGSKPAETVEVKLRYTARQTLYSSAAISLLNPYAWMDTVLVIGAIAASKDAGLRISFMLGTISASLIWFFFLTYFSHACRWLFTRKSAWRALDGLVACMMLSMALHLAATRF
jgi:L-lysine exporter family protein LysE/ArgO